MVFFGGGCATWSMTTSSWGVRIRVLKSLERRRAFLPQEGVEPKGPHPLLRLFINRLDPSQSFCVAHLAKVPLSRRQAGMAQDHLRDDLNGSSGSARKGRCMAS